MATISTYNLITNVEELNGFYPKIIISTGSVSAILSGEPSEEFDLIIEPQEEFPVGETLWKVKTPTRGTFICKVTVSEEGEVGVSTVWSSHTGSYHDPSHRYNGELFPGVTQVTDMALHNVFPGDPADIRFHVNPEPQTDPTFSIPDDLSETLNMAEEGLGINPVSFVDYGDYYLLGPIIPTNEGITDNNGGTPYIKVVKLDKATNVATTIKADLTYQVPTPAELFGGVVSGVNSVSLNGIVVPVLADPGPTQSGLLAHFDADTETVTYLPAPPLDDGEIIVSMSLVKENILFFFTLGFNPSRSFLCNFDGEGSTYLELSSFPEPNEDVIPLFSLADENYVYGAFLVMEDWGEFSGNPIGLTYLEKRSISDLSTVVASANIDFSSFPPSFAYPPTGSLYGETLYMAIRDGDALVVIELDSTNDFSIENTLTIPDAGINKALYVSHATADYLYIPTETGIVFVDTATFTVTIDEYRDIFWENLDDQSVRKHIIDSEDNIFIITDSVEIHKIHPDNGVGIIWLSPSGDDGGRVYPSEPFGYRPIDFTPENGRIITMQYDFFSVPGEEVYIIRPMIPGSYADGGGGPEAA